MNIIQYIKLYNYLTEQEYLNNREALHSILRVRKLPKEFQYLVIDIINGMIPDFSIREISLTDLMYKDDMRPIRAILFLDWLRREPQRAMQYMANESLMAGHQSLSKDKSQENLRDYERLKKCLDEKKRIEIEENIRPASLDDKSDITVE